MTPDPAHALVLTCPPASPCLTDALVTRAWRAIPKPARLEARWLSPGEAWSGRFVADASAPPVAALRQQISAIVDRLPCDVNIVPEAHRRKRLLVADMDSTIIGQECIDEMADALGRKAQISAITERAMKGEFEFEAALRERLALLAGLTKADLVRVYNERISLTPGARTLLATLRAEGAYTALVSGGFTFFTRLVAERAGFDETHANTLEFDRDDRLTGQVAGAILGREAKLATLERLAAERGIPMDATMAVGDGANDLAMIEAAGLGVAFRAKPVVAAKADASIEHGDLTALLYLQGYDRREFIGN